MKRAFITFTRLSVAKNYVRPESLSLICAIAADT